MNVKIDSRRRWKVIGALAVLGLVGAPAAVLATDRFPDVPFGSGHDEINKIDDAGIVRGCGNVGNFCPDNPVTRKQLAQFVSRAGGSASSDSRDLPGAQLLNPPASTSVLTIDVTVAGLQGHQQRVEVNADVVVRASSTAGCPCQAKFFLQDDSNPSTQFSAEHFVTLTDPTDTDGALVDVPISLSFVFTALTGTTHTYFLTGQTTGGSEVLRAYGDITATTYPFAN